MKKTTLDTSPDHHKEFKAANACCAVHAGPSVNTVVFQSFGNTFPTGHTSHRRQPTPEEAREPPKGRGSSGTGLWERPSLSPGPENEASAWRLQNPASLPSEDGLPHWPHLKQVQGQILARPQDVF